jgi:salicylate hydroxylase
LYFSATLELLAMSSSTPFRIVIVGGGIAGMAAAIALRGPNREVTILEQSRFSTEIGATISLQPNATRILQKTWGLTDVLEKASGMIDCGFRVYNIDGDRVNEVSLRNNTKYGADRIMWHRQDLHDFLKTIATATEGKGAAATLRTSSRVVRCDPLGGTITLEDGEELTADLIVAADGIHSRLRTDVLGKDIKARPTGLSAYRMMMSSDDLARRTPDFFSHIRPQDPYTSMIMAHSCRLIMGPARGGELYSVVGLVPDDRMNEDPDSAQSWVNEGDAQKMLATFKDFPQWTKDMLGLGLTERIGLWQLRDLDPLDTWTRGRVILIGDAAHAMLPTQGQGASQAIEDAEALGAFFSDVDGDSRPSPEQVASRLERVFKSRYTRATLIQKFSRESAKPATDSVSKEVKMRPDEFMDYNCFYRGAREWEEQQLSSLLEGTRLDDGSIGRLEQPSKSTQSVAV